MIATKRSFAHATFARAMSSCSLPVDTASAWSKTPYCSRSSRVRISAWTRKSDSNGGIVSEGVFGEYGQLYDLLYATKDSDAEAAYVAKLIERWTRKAGTLLDLGCGTGRHGRR